MDNKTLQKLTKDIHAQNIKKGFWDKKVSCNEIKLQIISEIIEAYESFSKGYAPVFHVDDKPEGYVIEICDTIMRILDYCEHSGFEMINAHTSHNFSNGHIKQIIIELLINSIKLILIDTGYSLSELFHDVGMLLIDVLESTGYDVESLIREKMAYNETRPYRYGRVL